VSRGAPAVVIAAWRRPALLERCLDAIAQQTLRPAQVIVASSDTASTPVLERFREALPLSVVPNPGRGPAAARNRALDEVRAQYVAFTDDDCRPAPTWLAELEQAAAPERILTGTTVVDPGDGPRRSVLDRAFEAGSADAERFSTCNVLYPTDLVRRLGGFDATFRFFGEDTDLGIRAVEAGASAHHCDGAVVFHAVHRRTLRAAMGEAWRKGTLVLLLRRHPAVRAGQAGRLFLDRAHRQTAIAIGALVLLPVTPFALASPLPWLRDARYRVDYQVGRASLPPRRQARELATLFLLDSIELVGCAVASLRWATPLL